MEEEFEYITVPRGEYQNYIEVEYQQVLDRRYRRYERELFLDEDSKTTTSKYIKPIKIDERIESKHLEFKENIINIENNILTYFGDIDYVKYCILQHFYFDYQIKIVGNVKLDNCNLKEISVKFLEVIGNFNIQENPFVFLNNLPRYIYGLLYLDNSSIRHITEFNFPLFINRILIMDVSDEVYDSFKKYLNNFSNTKINEIIKEESWNKDLGRCRFIPLHLRYSL